MYSYHRLVLGYGPNFGFSVTIQWKHLENSFHLSFGIQGKKVTGRNPHTIMAPRLKLAFNRSPDIARLAQILHDTIVPLMALRGLKEDPTPETSSLSQPSQQSAAVFSVAQRFLVIPVSETTIRTVFKGQLTLEFICLREDFVAVRDCTSAVSTERVVAGSFLSVPGLKFFLEKFDESGELDQSYSPVKKESKIL